MSLGKLQTEGDLARFIAQELERPGVLPPPKPAVSLTKAGVPSDADFPNPPGNGTLALDSTGPTLYARISGSWAAV